MVSVKHLSVVVTFSAILGSLVTSTRADLTADIVEVRRIWNHAPHNAFTDLVRWRDKFYCAFREGQGHAGDIGKLRIIVSDDGASWRPAGLLSMKDVDLRDAAVSITPDDRLMVLGGAQQVAEGNRTTGTFASFSEDGNKFSEPKIVVPLGRWLWRVTWHEGTAYGVSYATPKGRPYSALHKTDDGIEYETVTGELLGEPGTPTEARIRFGSDGTAYCLHRRDGTDNSAYLGTAKPPYAEWEWDDLGLRLGGPNFLQLPNGHWIAAGRLYDDGQRTELLHLDVDTGKVTPICRLPSGGDTSYPGLVWHDDHLWVSYYSSHEDKTSIYLAKVRIRDASQAEAAVDLGTRRELFVDKHLIAHMESTELRLHPPQPAEVVLRFDQPWEGAFCGYTTVINDDGRYLMYYRGLPKAGRDGTSSEVTCVAESRNGIDWTKPRLNLFEVNGSAWNNVVLKGHTPASHNFSPFLDSNPAAADDVRFKALGGTSHGLIAFASADGLRWRRLQQEPVFTKGIFDSQNVAFWSDPEQQYLCYFRTWTKRGYQGFRTISRTTSTDFMNWTDPVEMTFGATPYEHLYTNQTHPYYRAPHLYVGVAARFMPGRQVLTPEEAQRIGVNPAYYGDSSDAVLLTSRGGAAYQRTFMESFIRPGPGLENWVSRTNYPALGIVPTGDTEMSVYLQKNYGQPSARLQRYKLRIDGFASVHAGYNGGEMITRPVLFPPASPQELQSKSDSVRNAAGQEPAQVTHERPIFGRGSLQIRKPIAWTLPDTHRLGNQVTLAAHLRSVPADHRRLFSAYNGGSTAPGELILDINSGGNTDHAGAIRFFYDGLSVGAPVETTGVWSRESGNDAVHHVAVTWNDGVVTLYFDGRQVARGGSPGRGAIELALGNLQLGEDYPPTPVANEPLLGIADDVVVLRRALTGEEMKTLATLGAERALRQPAGRDRVWSLDSENQFVLSQTLRKGPSGRELHINLATSAAGSVRVELQDAAGQPLPGFTLNDCDLIIGDRIDRIVTWQGQSELQALAGKPIRLRFEMKDADLYSLQVR